MVCLAVNNYGKLGRNAHWQAFWFGERTILSVHCFIIHMIICSVVSLAIEAKIAKPPN